MLNYVWLLATPWTVACQTSLSLGFCRQEYWTGLPFPPPEDLPSPGIKPMSPVSPALQEDSLPAEPTVKHLIQGTLKSCPTLCDPMDYSPQSSSVHGIFRQEYWSGLSFPSPRNLPDPRIEPALVPALAGRFFTTSTTWEAHLTQ